MGLLPPVVTKLTLGNTSGSPVQLESDQSNASMASTVSASLGFDSEGVIDFTICSFALHLIDNPSELFAILWELSTKCRWLVVLSPHKRPNVVLLSSQPILWTLMRCQIKHSWGWDSWQVKSWTRCEVLSDTSEFVRERSVDTLFLFYLS